MPAGVGGDGDEASPGHCDVTGISSQLPPPLYSLVNQDWPGVGGSGQVSGWSVQGQPGPPPPSVPVTPHNARSQGSQWSAGMLGQPADPDSNLFFVS